MGCDVRGVRSPKKCSICKSSNWTHSSGARCLKTVGKLLEVRTFGPPTNPKFLPAYQAITI